MQGFGSIEVAGKTKKQLRQEAKARRGLLDMVSLSDALAAQVAKWPVFQEAQEVLLYAALAQEVNLLSLTDAFPEKAWYLPRVDRSVIQMTFHRYQPGDVLVKNRFGIEEPQPHSEQWQPLYGRTIPALMFVPALLLDSRGIRLGFGQGYYDRYLAQHPEKLITACVLPCSFLVEALPKDPWDVSVGYAITEAGPMALMD